MDYRVSDSFARLIQRQFSWVAASSLVLLLFPWPNRSLAQEKPLYWIFSQATPSVSFSPDGKYFAASGREDFHQSIFIWESATGKPVKKFGKFSGMKHVLFAPDGKTLATPALNGPARIWKADTGEILQEFRGCDKGTRNVAYAPDSKTLATADWDNHVRLWDVASGKLLATLKHQGDSLLKVAFSPNGKKLATGDWSGRLDLWDLESQKVHKTMETGEKVLLYLGFSPDSKLLVSVCQNNNLVQVWDVDQGHVRQALALEKKDYGRHGLEAAALSKDGKQLLTGSWSGKVHLWELATGKLLATFTPDFGMLKAVALSPDGMHAAIITSRSAILMWKIPKEK